MAKRGRPRKGDIRNVPRVVRMTKEEDEFFKDISERSGMSQSDIMRIGGREFAMKLAELYPAATEYEDWELGIYDDYPDEDEYSDEFEDFEDFGEGVEDDF